VNPAQGPATLVIESIEAGVPATPDMPEWLGKRPPVAGDWVQTFDDEFDGTALDLKKWNNEGPNYWDHKSHWSKDDLIVKDGVVRLRYEKKTGFQNDDPKQPKSDYAGGYLETRGKWTQRYGYFETRMKLPRQPGLWPAFWMMPDRGANVANREDTGSGGMEVDILEHLTRWGPYRYNIAMHWDGYGREHKSTGTDKIYVQTDKEGFIAAGLLWTPGLLAFYGNGREVARWECDRVASVPAYIMFTQPQGGWDNNRVDDRRLPADLVIDYVRAWQRRDLAAPAPTGK
jgi:beta-glucanase (GH16 family)